MRDTLEEAADDQREGIALLAKPPAYRHWRHAAYPVLINHCFDTPEVFCDYWWDYMWSVGYPNPPLDPTGVPAYRLLGPLFQDAQRFGWMTKTEESRKSRNSRLGPKPVWRSNLYRR